MTIKNGCTKKVLWLLESSIIVFALFAKAEVIPYDGSESVLVAFIARLRDSFEGSDITGLILFAVFYYLQREAALRKLKNDWRIILLSGLFAVMYIAARSMDDSGTLAAVTFLLRNNVVYELLPFMLLLLFSRLRGMSHTPETM